MPCQCNPVWAFAGFEFGAVVLLSSHHSPRLVFLTFASLRLPGRAHVSRHSNTRKITSTNATDVVMIVGEALRSAASRGLGRCGDDVGQGPGLQRYGRDTYALSYQDRQFWSGRARQDTANW